VATTICSCGGARGQPGALLHAPGRTGGCAPIAGPWSAARRRARTSARCWLDARPATATSTCSSPAAASTGRARASELLRDRLYRNDGGLRFVDATVAALPDVRRASSCHAAAADFDGDGDLDLCVAGTASCLGGTPTQPRRARLLPQRRRPLRRRRGRPRARPAQRWHGGMRDLQ
jgi:hypothetical protein